MKKSTLFQTPYAIAVVLAAIAISVPAIFANKVSIPSGSLIKLVVGEKATITVGGTQGCKFDVLTNSTNSKVAGVSPSSTQKPSHKVTIEGLAVGNSTVTLVTANGSIPQCQGFEFTYPVTVTPSSTAILAQAKTKIADAAADLKALYKAYLTEYCDILELAADGLADNSLSTAEVISQLIEFTDATIADMAADAEDLMEDLAADLTARGVAAGFTALTFPRTLMMGGCGMWDAFITKALLDFDKAIEGLRKKAKAFAKQVDAADRKKGGQGITVSIPPAILTVGEGLLFIVDANPVPPPAPLKNLKITWAASARLNQNSTGELRTGGIADPTNGAVSVTITGPGGFSQTIPAAVDAKCTWSVSLAGLAPGQYVISASQGALGPVTRTHTVL